MVSKAQKLTSVTRKTSNLISRKTLKKVNYAQIENEPYFDITTGVISSKKKKNPDVETRVKGEDQQRKQKEVVDNKEMQKLEKDNNDKKGKGIKMHMEIKKFKQKKKKNVKVEVIKM